MTVGNKVSKPVNYTLNSQKITFEFLKTHLWSAADILRGSLDASEYRQPVMTLLFLKRLNDTFEENAEKFRQRGKIIGNRIACSCIQVNCFLWEYSEGI